MTDNYTNSRNQQTPYKGRVCTVAPLTNEEKADLKMRILLAINTKMA